MSDMQISANSPAQHVATKNISSNTASSSAATSDVKPNELDAEPMSFAQFEQKINKQPEQQEDLAEADGQALPSAEELALQIEQLLAQVANPAASQQAPLLVNGQLANGEAGTAGSEALELAQQLATSTAPALASATTAMPLAQSLSGMNPLPGQELDQQADQLLAMLAGQEPVKGTDKADLLERVQQFLTQKSGSFAQAKAGDGSFAQAKAGDGSFILSKNAVMSRDGAVLSADHPMATNESALMDKLANTLLSASTSTSSTLSSLAMNVTNNINSNASQGLNGQSPSQLVAASSSVTQQLQASVDITKPEWGRDLVEQLRSRLQLSKSDQIQHAHVRLDPPELGRLDVNLRLDGDKVSVHFTAAHPQLREALAANAERLRFDFDGSQMQLTDVSVSSGMYQQSQQQSGQHDEPEIMTNQFITGNEETQQRTAMTTSVGRYESMI
ncbi:flagellar hook-length control protein FliK [Photobacterium sagamiensis]|uniref:flagellar hook-length control protein FliK n=1 Tax=Photobacterium sagamiensis TaxID=2910241 RepID=UPI003D09CFAB